MTRTSIVLLLLSALVSLQDASVAGFVLSSPPTRFPATSTSSTSSTSLCAIGALAKKAKQSDLRQYVQEGIDDAVMEKYKAMQAAMADMNDTQFWTKTATAGPLQSELTKRAGTLTVIAEYKRKMTVHGFISDVFDPELLSPVFREFGASAIAVMACPRMGGCHYEDLQQFVQEQQRASYEVPGPVMVINNDLVIDELQLARAAALGAVASVVTLSVVGEDDLKTLLQAGAALDMEMIVAVSTVEEAQKAIDAGARLLRVDVPTANAKTALLQALQIPENRPVCMIATIQARDDRSLTEIEEAWAVRDFGFQTAWIGEALYKFGASASEHPGAIIKSIKSKSSLKWASPKASAGRGEGAREYLGDIMM